MDQLIKVMIVDDSPTARNLLTFIIESDPGLKVINIAENGEKALLLLEKEKPDVILMDVVMPGMDGFETTRRIMQTKAIPIIIVSTSYEKEDIHKSFKAIEAGALAILEKPKGPQDPTYPKISQTLIETIKMVSEVKLITRHSILKPPSKNLVTSAEKLSPKVNIEAIGIGTSLGGPQALSLILSELPPTFPVPIFIVQHISSGFTEGFVDWLNKFSRLKVKLAHDQEMGLPGTVYIAPDHFHMEIMPKNIINLVKASPEGGLRPSVAHLFRSMAKSFGPHAVGVILTGMGRDGVDDLLAMKQAGAITIAQDEASSLMFGMPREAIAAGAVSRILPLSQIAHNLKMIVNCFS